METPEKLINVAWVGGEMYMRERILSNLRHMRWVAGAPDQMVSLDEIMARIEELPITKVEK